VIFESETANVTDVHIGSVNCTDDRSICERLSLTTYPTFLVRWSAAVFPVTVPASSMDFHDVLGRLRRLENGTLFRNFTAMPGQYPAVIIRLHAGDREGRLIASRGVAAARFMSTGSVFFNLTAAPGTREAYVYTDVDVPILMGGDFTAENIVRFILANPFELFAAWSLQDIRNLHRLFASVFLATWPELGRYRELAKATRAQFAWGSAVAWPESEIGRFGLAPGDMPAISVIEVDRDRCYALKNASDLTQARYWLKKFAGDGELIEHVPLMLQKKATKDRVVNWDATPIPEPSPTQEPGPDTDIREAVKWGFTVFAATLVVLLPIALLFTYGGLAIADRRAQRSKAKHD
jgi:hypothetical protein